MKVIFYLGRLFLFFITLFIFEIIIGCLILYILTLDFEKSIQAVFFFNYFRLLFYSLPLTIMYLLYAKDFLSINIKYKPLLISLFNLTIIIFFILMTIFIFDFIKFIDTLNKVVFSIILSIFIAPMVVCLVPYYKRIVSKL